MDVMPVSVSLLVYIDVASAVKISASFGMCNDFSSVITEVEFFTKEFT